MTGSMGVKGLQVELGAGSSAFPKVRFYVYIAKRRFCIQYVHTHVYTKNFIYAK